MAARQAWLAVLARADRADVAAMLADAAIPSHLVLKPAEIGTIMVEGRAGGSGRRFNAGEATLARCVIRLDDGTIGASYALGRDLEKARLAAIVDALLQGQPPGTGLHREVAALGERQMQARELASRKAAATKVEFFTMVRGN